MECPYCNGKAYAEFVDVGVGEVQVTPYQCQECGASQIGGYDEENLNLSDIEKKYMWYEPPTHGKSIV